MINIRVSCWGLHYTNNVFSFDTGKAHCGHKYTPLLLNGLIKIESLAADDSTEVAIGLIKVLKAFASLITLPSLFFQHFC